MKRRQFIAGLGSAVAWPLVARAQPATPVIGFLTINNTDSSSHTLPPFLQGLHEQGFVERRNVEILSRYADTKEDRLPALAADLVQRRVAAIFVVPNVGFARIAKNATATIPIVFSAGGDPVESGLVANLNRPGGNVRASIFQPYLRYSSAGTLVLVV